MSEFAKHIQSGKFDLSLLAAIPCSTIVTDENENICFWSDRAAAQYQYSSTEIIGQPLSVIVPPRFHKTLADLISDENKSLTVPHSTIIDIYGRAKDGTEFPIQMSIIEYKFDQFPCYLVVTLDTMLAEAKIMAKLVAKQLSILNKKLDELPITQFRRS